MLERQPLWTRAYLSLCASLFLVSGQQSMVLVVLPLYITHLGGSAFVAGLALFCFSLPSFSSRPIVGHWADSWSLVGVYTAGGLLLGLTTSLYLLPILAAVFAVNMLRGFGWAGAMTGSYAILAHVSPAERRGEASGYFSSVFSATTILFPALGLWLFSLSTAGYRAVFLLASVLALVSAAISHTWLRPALPRSDAVQRGSGAGLRALAGMLTIERSVLMPTLMSFSVTLAQPAVSAFLPLYARHQGITNIASYFILAGIASLTIRPLLGRFSDRFGQGYFVVAGFLAMMLGVCLIVVLGTLAAILAGGVLIALGNATCSAAILGLAVDMAHPQRRGAAMGTFTISFQLGNGIGSILAGALVSLAGYRSMYAGALVILLLGLLLGLRNWSLLSRRAAPTPAEAEAAG